MWIISSVWLKQSRPRPLLYSWHCKTFWIVIKTQLAYKANSKRISIEAVEHVRMFSAVLSPNVFRRWSLSTINMSRAMFQHNICSIEAADRCVYQFNSSFSILKNPAGYECMAHIHMSLSPRRTASRYGIQTHAWVLFRSPMITWTLTLTAQI